MLAVGIEPESELAEALWCTDLSDSLKRFLRDKRVREAHNKLLQLSSTFYRSLAHSQLRAYEVADYIPSDLAVQYIVEKGIHSEAFEIAIAKNAHRESVGHQVRKEVASRPEDHSKSLGKRERITLLKLIGAMAIKGYKYNPNASRNDAVPDIARDLELVGAPLDQDTIRDKLREAADVLAEIQS